MRPLLGSKSSPGSEACQVTDYQSAGFGAPWFGVGRRGRQAGVRSPNGLDMPLNLDTSVASPPGAKRSCEDAKR